MNLCPTSATNGRTPVEIITGETPDISEMLHFDFFGWVKYYDPYMNSFPKQCEALGRWLGIAHDVGQAMTYYILKDNGEIVVRSSVRNLTDEELHDASECKKREEFNRAIKEHLGEYDEQSKLAEALDELEEPSRVEVDSDVVNDDVCEPMGDPDDNQDNPDDDESVVDADPFLKAEVFMPHNDHVEIGTVIGWKKTPGGRYVGKRNPNPILDSRMYIVEFPDGDQQELTYNNIVQHLYSQVDAEGNQYFLYKDIINHRKTRSAVEKKDQYKKTGNNISKKRTTAGWELEVKWKDGSTSWLTLKELKETNAVEVAQYAVNNKIDHEPAFDWWVRDVVRRKNRLIKMSKSAKVREGYKFGIQIPRDVEDALQLDRENGNTLWQDSLEKEMSNMRVVFKPLKCGEQPPPGYKCIPCHVVFDVKMDFTRKS